MDDLLVQRQVATLVPMKKSGVLLIGQSRRGKKGGIKSSYATGQIEQTISFNRMSEEILCLLQIAKDFSGFN
jgi:hypothetical protein